MGGRRHPLLPWVFKEIKFGLIKKSFRAFFHRAEKGEIFSVECWYRSETKKIWKMTSEKKVLLPLFASIESAKIKFPSLKGERKFIPFFSIFVKEEVFFLSDRYFHFLWVSSLTFLSLLALGEVNTRKSGCLRATWEWGGQKYFGWSREKRHFFHPFDWLGKKGRKKGNFRWQFRGGTFYKKCFWHLN